MGLPVQLRERSEDDADDELLSVAIVKHGSKAVTGSQTGVLSLYSWGYSKDCSDRFPGELSRAACCTGLCLHPKNAVGLYRLLVYLEYSEHFLRQKGVPCRASWALRCIHVQITLTHVPEEPMQAI